MLLWLISSCFHRLRNLLVLKFLFKSLPQRLFRSEAANSNKLISRCHHDAGLGPYVLQVAEKQSKARTLVITGKRRIQNVPKWGE